MTLPRFKSSSLSVGILSGALILSACGKKEDKDEAAPVQPKVEITGNDKQGGFTKLNYRSDVPGATYECKVDQEGQIGQWAPCDPSGFQLPTDSSQAALFSVRAKVGGIVGEAQSVYIGGNDGAFEVVIHQKNSPDSVTQENGELQITFEVSGSTAAAGLSFECKVGHQAGYLPCQSPFNFARNADGSYPNVTVRAKTPAGQYSIADTINLESYFDNQSAQPMFRSLQIGSYYQFVVPQGMHVTEFSTNKTESGLSVWRIMNDSDPYYNVNTMCVQEWDMVRQAVSPTGRRLNYCNSTPTEGVFKAVTGRRWANNHIQVATEPQNVAQSQNGREIITINAFDSANLEQMREKTKFGELCGNAYMERISVHELVPLFYDFWGEPVRASFWSCTVYLNSLSPDGLMESHPWKVGAFMIVNGRSELPDFNCRRSCGQVPHLLEVVYMARTAGEPEMFARMAQQRFQENLHPIQPN